MISLFGKLYHSEMKQRYSLRSSVFVLLAPAADDASVVNPDLLKANESKPYIQIYIR